MIEKRTQGRRGKRRNIERERERDGGRLVSVAIRAEDLVTSVSHGKGEPTAVRANETKWARISARFTGVS